MNSERLQIPPKILNQDQNENNGVRPSILSSREIDLLQLVRQGKTTHHQGLAEILGIREATVRNHFHSIYKKLGINGKDGSKKIRSIVKAIDLGILEPFRPNTIAKTETESITRELEDE